MSDLFLCGQVGDDWRKRLGYQDSVGGGRQVWSISYALRSEISLAEYSEGKISPLAAHQPHQNRSDQ